MLMKVQRGAGCCIASPASTSQSSMAQPGAAWLTLSCLPNVCCACRLNKVKLAWRSPRKLYAVCVAYLQAGDASGTGLFDPAKRDYDPTRLASIDSELHNKFPELITPNEVGLMVLQYNSCRCGLWHCVAAAVKCHHASSLAS